MTYDLCSRCILQISTDKTGETVPLTLLDIFKGSRRPNRVRSDMGQEFRSRKVQTVFKENNIRHFYSTNEMKSSISERTIKTLKSRITRYMTYKQNYRQITVLQIYCYNQTHRRTTDTEPANVTKRNEERVRLSTYFSKPLKEQSESSRFKSKIGDHVRIAHLRNVFTREYDQMDWRDVHCIEQILKKRCTYIQN